MQKELTPAEIASMSEVVAKYMGYKYKSIADIDNSDCGGIYDRCKVFAKIPIEIDAYPNSDQYYIKTGWHQLANENGGYLINPDFIKWDWIHEVWEKVRGKLPITNHEIGLAAGAILYGTPLEAFTALYHAIEFINNLKQENDNNKSI
jgi:hypothetical protein